MVVKETQCCIKNHIQCMAPPFLVALFSLKHTLPYEIKEPPSKDIAPPRSLVLLIKFTTEFGLKVISLFMPLIAPFELFANITLP